MTTADNGAGEAVVQYFSGQTDIQPPSCGAFVRTENDNSRLAGVCQKWGPKNQGRNMVYGLRAQSPKYDWNQGSEERAQGSSPPFFLRDSRACETRARVKITPREKRRHAAEREKNEALQTKPKLLN